MKTVIFFITLIILAFMSDAIYDAIFEVVCLMFVIIPMLVGAMILYSTYLFFIKKQ